MKHITTFGCLLLISFSLLARSFPGYVIVSEGDTVQGYLFKAKESKLARKIGFSSTKTNRPEIIYSPFDIQGFQFLGTRFIAANVLVEDQLNKKTDYTFAEPPISRPLQVFLTVEAEGAASLYYFRDDSSHQHYYIKTDQTDFQELIQYKYLKNKEQVSSNQSNTSQVVHNRHHRILKRLLQDCPDIQTNIEETDVNRVPLIRLIESYNECVSPPSSYVNPNSSETPVTWHIQLGASTNDVQLEYYTGQWDVHYPIEPTPSFLERSYPSVGINVQFYSSVYQPRWYIGSGLWHKIVPIKGQSISGNEAAIARGSYVEYRYNSHVIQFSLPVEIGHIFRLGDVLAQISAGGMLSYSRPSNLSRKAQEYREGEAIFEEKEFLLFSKRSYFEASSYVSLGFTYGKWGIKSYAINSLGLVSPSTSVSLNNQAILVALTYKIAQSRGNF